MLPARRLGSKRVPHRMPAGSVRVTGPVDLDGIARSIKAAAGIEKGQRHDWRTAIPAR